MELIVLIKELNIAPYQRTADEEYMCETQRTHFKKILKAWQDHILSESANTRSLIQHHSSSVSDHNDMASQAEEMRQVLRKGSRDSKLLRRIDQIIEAIDKGDYGHCQICGSDIGIKRLEARPVANKCIDCKTIEEEEELLCK